MEEYRSSVDRLRNAAEIVGTSQRIPTASSEDETTKSASDKCRKTILD
jgi:hypothetical protein